MQGFFSKVLAGFIYQLIKYETNKHHETQKKKLKQLIDIIFFVTCRVIPQMKISSSKKNAKQSAIEDNNSI